MGWRIRCCCCCCCCWPQQTVMAMLHCLAPAAEQLTKWAIIYGSPQSPVPTPVQILMHTWHVAIALGRLDGRRVMGGGVTNVWKVSGNSGSCNIIDLPHWQTTESPPPPPIAAIFPAHPWSIHASFLKFAYFATLSLSLSHSHLSYPKSNSVNRHKADKLGRHGTLSPPRLPLYVSLPHAVFLSSCPCGSPLSGQPTLSLSLSLAPTDFKSA